jgi:hypothetical protein
MKLFQTTRAERLALLFLLSLLLVATTLLWIWRSL